MLKNFLTGIASVPDAEVEKEKAEKLAVSFAQNLQQAKDFKPLIERFFAANYLENYLRDHDTNWFLNLNPDTAAQASHSQLQRFYVALLNTGYLMCQLQLANVKGQLKIVSARDYFH